MWSHRKDYVARRQSQTRRSSRRDKQSRLSRIRARLELLEDRTLLAVNFLAGPLQVPAVNRIDVPVGNFNAFEEINVAVNERFDPGNIAITSHNDIVVSTQMFVPGPNTNTGNFPDPAPATNRGDNWADFDSQGRLFYTNLDGNDPPTAPTVAVAVVEVNRNTGAPIGAAVVVNQPPATESDDRQALAADSNPLSPFADNIYTVWTRFGLPVVGTEVFVSRSADHGVTWSAPVQISDHDGPDNLLGTADDEGFVQQAHIAVGPGGVVYAAYHAQPGFVAGGLAPDGVSGQIIVCRSTDGGLTFPTRSVAIAPGGADITFNRQEPAAAGTTIARTRFLTQGSVQPYVLADPIRPGRVYVIAADDPDNTHGAGDDADIVLATSNDYGVTWSARTLVSGPGSFQLFPTAAIDRFGNIAVAWYDNRRNLRNSGLDGIPGNADDDYLLDVYATYSVDGGQTWAPEFRVNDEAFDPDEPPVVQFGSPPGPTTRIGEYFGLDLFGGTAYVAFHGNDPAAPPTAAQRVVFDAFPIAGSLVVDGDDRGSPYNDVFVLQAIAGNPDMIEILVNGIRQYAGLREGVSGGITINLSLIHI